MWSFSQSAREKCEVKRGSLSEITLVGSPNHRYTCSRYSCATPSPVMVVEQGRNTAALEHPWSMIVRMASLPSLLGSWVIRSMATVLKGSAVGCAGMWNNGGLFFVVRFLFCWQIAHPFMLHVDFAYRR